MKAVLNALKKYSINTKGKLKVNEITADPTDNMFLSSAKEAEADFIVTGDNHLLNLINFKGTSILTASRFLEVLKQRIS
ncbi:MAG: hypothetical protein HY776_06890 [Actinobacteria bacterium]|nr:hypothetical protein [Actinomycetota bacterium]